MKDVSVNVVRFSLYEVVQHLVTPFRASSHSHEELHHLLVRLEDASGAVGWGECATNTDPFYLGETHRTAWHIIEEFVAPRVLGKPWQTIEEFTKLFSLVKGNTFAKAGVEMAGWDLLGRMRETSVAHMLGGSRSEILSGVSLGIERDKEQLLDRVRKHLEEGYRRIKLKIAPGYDLVPLGWVREAFPSVPLMADANAAYTLADTAHLAQLDPLQLTMIEQPLGYDDLRDHAELQRRITTPVCLDESVRSAATAREAVLQSACRIVNVKVAKVGGLLEAKRIHDVCFAANIGVWCGGMHDYGVGRAANVALASLSGFTIPGDVSGFDKYFVEDIVEPPIVAVRGAIAVPYDRPGLGFDVVEERVRARSVREVDLRVAERA
jgi:O-succinylbenzoate synthase